MKNIELLGEFSKDTEAPVFFHTDMKLNPDTIYVMKQGENIICYKDVSFWARSPGETKAVLFSPPRIGGVNELEIEFFRLRFKKFRDVGLLSSFFEQFPDISPETLINTIEQNLQIQLSEKERYIFISLLQGKTKLKLMQEGIPYESIYAVISFFLERLLYYTSNEFERKYLACFLQLVAAGPYVFYYQSKEDFAESFHISTEIVDKIEETVFSSQTCLSSLELEQLKTLLVANNWDMSAQDSELLISRTKKISKEYIERERNFYKQHAEELFNPKKATMYDTLIDEIKKRGYDYKKFQYYIPNYYRRTIEKRRKKLKDYLD